MADAITAVYDFTLPEVNASDDTWGGKLNANWQKMETLLDSVFNGGTPSLLGTSLTLGSVELNVAVGTLARTNGALIYNVPTTFLHQFRVDSTNAAFIEPAGPSISSLTLAVITAEKGDARYARLAVNNAFTANQTISSVSPVLNFFETDQTLPAGRFRIMGFNGLFQINRNTAVAGDYSTNEFIATFENAGTAISAATAVVTKEKGDFRYLQQAGGTLTGALTVPSLIVGAFQLNVTVGVFERPGGAIVYNVDTSFLHQFRINNINALHVEAPGTSVPNTYSAITREKGDARYLQLTGGTLTGALTVPSLTIGAFQINVTNGVIGRPGGAIIYNVDTGFLHQFRVNNVNALHVEAPGTSVPNTYSAITREKGDARYVQLGVSGTVTSDITFAAGLIAGNVIIGSVGFPNSVYNVGGSLSFYVPAASIIAFGVAGAGGALSARVDAVGTSAPSTTTIMTREKADFRYALTTTLLNALNALSGSATVIQLRDAIVSALNAAPSDPPDPPDPL